MACCRESRGTLNKNIRGAACVSIMSHKTTHPSKEGTSLSDATWSVVTHQPVQNEELISDTAFFGMSGAPSQRSSTLPQSLLCPFSRRSGQPWNTRTVWDRLVPHNACVCMDSNMVVGTGLHYIDSLGLQHNLHESSCAH